MKLRKRRPVNQATPAASQYLARPVSYIDKALNMPNRENREKNIIPCNIRKL